MTLGLKYTFVEHPMLIHRGTIVWLDLHANVTRKFQDHKEGSLAYFLNKRKSLTTLIMRISRSSSCIMYKKHLLSKRWLKFASFLTELNFDFEEI